MTASERRQEMEGFIGQLKEEGFGHIRVYVNIRKALCCGVQCQELKYQDYGSSIMYLIEADWGGEYCCAYADSFEDKAEIFTRLKDSAGIFEDRSIPEPIGENRDLRGCRWKETDMNSVTEVLKCAEREALECENADFVEICEYQQYEETIVLIDENMNCLSDDDGDCTFTIRVIARDGEAVSAATKMGIVKVDDIDGFRKKACTLARRAAKYAGLGLHAKEITSGSYPIVLENCIAAELIGQYLPIFYAENIQQQASVLAGKEGNRVGSRILRLEEDPFCSQGTCRRRIDDEGEKVSKKLLLHNGVFEQALYNRKTASKAGLSSTGNGFKPDVTGDIGTGATNIILSSEEESFSRKELIASAESGIYITRIDGMFAGADIESGDFSLLASGNRIRNGRICEAVHQFTISGNICELWKNIEQIGDDPVYRITGGACILSPTLKIRALAVSGR